MRRITKIAAGLAVAAGVGMAFVLPAEAAVSLSSPVSAVQVQSPGVLIARGAAVTVPVLVVCLPGTTGYGDVALTQRVGQGIAKGYGQTSFRCTGDPQVVQVLVTASDISNKAFHPGTALADANVVTCTNYFCYGLRDTRAIKLSNKP